MENVECKHCGRKFDSNNALKQHQTDKHPEIKSFRIEEIRPKVKLKKVHLVVIFSIITLTIIATYFLFLKSSAQYTPLSPPTEHVKGSENATITIVEFSDFQCPFCGKFWRETLPEIENEYIDSGKVKLVYKHFPLRNIHQYAQKAAEASECAADQGKFWEYHDKLFSSQPAFATNELKRYANELGLNMNLFSECLDSGVMTSRVQADFEDGQNKGVSGTPYFVINSETINGAQPFYKFKDILDRLMSKEV